MSLADVFKKLTGKEDDEEYAAKEIIDRPLDSLRRQRQHQLNEEEREELKKKIREYQKDFQRKHLWGVKNTLKEKRVQQLKEAINKKRKVNIMAAQKSILTGGILDNKKEEFKEKKLNILDNHSRFI